MVWYLNISNDKYKSIFEWLILISVFALLVLGWAGVIVRPNLKPVIWHLFLFIGVGYLCHGIIYKKPYYLNVDSKWSKYLYGIELFCFSAFILLVVKVIVELVYT